MPLTSVARQATGNGNTTTLTVPKRTFTVTLASPGVVTSSAHGMEAGRRVRLFTTGALPTGLAVATTYYVVNPTADTFELSLTDGGASINTSGSQSGTHSYHCIGDFLVVWNRCYGSSAADVNPSGLQKDQNDSNSIGRGIIFSKIIDGTETTITGMLTASTALSWIAAIFRGNTEINWRAWAGGNGQVTNSDPTLQTIAMGSTDVTPVIGVGHVSSSNAVSPRTNSPAMTEIAGPSTGHYAHHIIYGTPSTPLDNTYDMDDEGNPNIIQSGYYKLKGPHNTSMDGSVGEFALTGIDVGTVRAWNFTSALGEFLMEGQDVSLIKPGALTLMATGTSFVLTGIAVVWKISWAVSVGAFTLAGIDAALMRAVSIVAAVGTFVLTGVAAAFHRAWHLVAGLGSFNLGGFSIRVILERIPFIRLPGAVPSPRTVSPKLEANRTSSSKLRKV